MDARIEQLRARVAGLGPEARAALRARAEAAGLDWARIAPPPAAPPRPARVPLSPAQTQFWLLQKMEPRSAAFSIAFAWDIDGPLDRAALSAALRWLVERHEALRLGFGEDDDAPFQTVSEAEFVLEHVDCASAEAADADERAFAARPFELSQPPLFRARLQDLAPNRARLLFAFHHIIADGWSRGVILRDISAAYAAFRAGRAPETPPPAQFPDLALAQLDWLEGPAAQAQADFWREELKGLSAQDLPGRAPSGDRRADTRLRRIDPAIAARIAPVAATLGVSPFILLLAVFQLLTQRLSDREDVALGVPTAGRGDSAAAGAVGLFVNTLVVRVGASAGLRFRDWTAHVRDSFARAFAHQDLPFARVVEAVGAPRRAGRTPLFQTLFQAQTGGYAHQNAERVDLGDPRLQIRQRPTPAAEAKFDLNWMIAERDGGLSMLVEYRAAMFDAEWIDRMIDWFETLLAAALDRPDAPVAALQMMPRAEAEQAVLRGPQVDIPALSSLLAPQGAADDLALICARSGERWSRGRLTEATQRLARRLRARPELAARDALVAIALPRGPQMVVAILAALEARLPYIPLDPDHPAARRDAILRQSGAALLLSSDRVAAPCPVLDPEDIPTDAPEAAPRAEDPDALAYLIYTSGSTGAPKGVPVTRRSLANLLLSMARAPGLAQGERFMAVTTIAFDIAALELLLPLSRRATLVLADARVSGDPALLADALSAHRVTAMQATPATWRMLLENGWAGRAQMRALCGGEALPADLARALSARVAQLWNMYGPTETTIWSAARQIAPGALREDAPAPVGGAVANTTLRVCGPQGDLRPPGVAGELVIGGAGLSPGYWGRDDLTEAAFFERDGERLYRTGDVARLESGGALSFLGRRDHQIKLNGYRIEAGEVEAALMAIPGVLQAVVGLRDGRLVAWLRKSADAPEDEALRARLRAQLPGYMVPATLIALDAFALNANGKIDRAALPDPQVGPRSEARAARNRTEEALRAIWLEVLGRDAIGFEDNFFAHGGDSVAAMRIASRARAQGLALTPRLMFEHQTIAAQAQALAETADDAPLSPWQAARLDDAGPDHVVRHAMSGPCQLELQAAAALLAQRHPALRMSLDGARWRLSAELPNPAMWRARLSGSAVEVTVSALLLDGPSARRLAAQLAALMQGEAPPAADDGWVRWLDAAPHVAAGRLDAFPADASPPAQPDEPVMQSLRIETTRDRLSAALLVTFAQWRGSEAVSLGVIDRAQTGALGCFTRLRCLRLSPAPKDLAQAHHAVRRQFAEDDPRGVDPREIADGAALLNWAEDAPAPPGWALLIEVRPAPGRLALRWRFDPARLRRASVERLAARCAALLAPSAPPSGADKLDRLRAKLMAAQG